MKRRKMRKVAQRIAEELERKGYEYWKAFWESQRDDSAVTSPMRIEAPEMDDVQAELSLLERGDGYILMSLAVDDSTWPSAYLPVVVGVFVESHKS